MEAVPLVLVMVIHVPGTTVTPVTAKGVALAGVSPSDVLALEGKPARKRSAVAGTVTLAVSFITIAATEVASTSISERPKIRVKYNETALFVAFLHETVTLAAGVPTPDVENVRVEA